MSHQSKNHLKSARGESGRSASLRISRVLRARGHSATMTGQHPAEAASMPRAKMRGAGNLAEAPRTETKSGEGARASARALLLGSSTGSH